MTTLVVSVRIALAALMQNRVRSILTLLGMVIGVGAVIAIVSLGEGLRKDFETQITALGADVFYMTPKSPKRPGQAPKSAAPFKMADMRAIEEHCPSVQRVVPSVETGVMAKYRNVTRQSHVVGGYDDYLQSANVEKVDRGRFFDRAEVQNSARVVVIGHDISQDLFEDWEDPVGKLVKLNGVNYTVVGTLTERKGVMAGPPDVSTGFIAPITTVQKRVLGSEDVFWVSLYLKPGADLTVAKDEVAQVMRQRRRVRNVSDDDFQFISPDDFLKAGNQVINVMVGVFGAIAFISLLVGGVGIMNIMLVSVTERTREIGIRMAMGANRAVVLNQFLVEAVVLTLIGGLIGIILGFGAAVGVSFLLERVLNTNWSPHIPPVWVAYAVGVSVLVGVIFGVYPAFKASQLDPVEAMRYE
jgi:putative ABC transport system permease protein